MGIYNIAKTLYLQIMDQAPNSHGIFKNIFV